MAEQRRDVEVPTAGIQDQLMAALQHATIGEYEVLAQAGRGGMAAVYLAHDLALDRKVAIKVMYPELFSAEGGAERFKREARTAASLNHPNIIPIYSVQDREDLLYFVMQFVAGRTLDSVCTELGPLPIGLIQTIAGEVGSALGFAHRRGVIHRDVKPGNILLDEEGRTLVTDFGIAKVSTAEDLTRTGGIVGTPAFMSPEQCQAEALTGASDQYALGAVCYKMLTGHTPFSGDSVMNVMFQHATAEPPRLEESRTDCPPAIAAAVHRMLEKRPEDRWPTVEEAVRAIGAVPPAMEPGIRGELRTLALTGDSRMLLDRLRTPTSPVPPARPRSGVSREPVRKGAEERPAAPRVPRLVWILPIVAMAVGVAVFWPRGAVMAPGVDGVSAGDELAPVPVAEVALIEIADVPALEVGQSRALSATALDAEGAAVEALVRWTSRDPAVVRVSDDGVLTAVGPGRAGVVARAGGATATLMVRVSQTVRRPPPVVAPPPVVGLVISPRSGTIAVGGQLEFQATPRDASGNALAGPQISWTSSDRAVATVAGGIVTGIAPGAVRITASADGVVEAVAVQVTPVPVAALDISPTAPVLEIGRTLQLRATLRDSAGELMVGRTVAWHSTDSSIARVSPSGRVTAVAEGTATVTALSDAETANAAVTVVAPNPRAETAPDSARDHQVITATLAGFAEAWQNHDIPRLRRAYPAMTSQEEVEFARYELLQDFTVRVAPGVLIDVQGNGANARGTLTCEYRDRGVQTCQFEFRATLERVGDGWRLVSFQWARLE